MTGARPSVTWSLAQWLAWLEEGPRGGIDLGLDRVARVAERLALAPRPTVTIAGTNGKGSCAQVAADLAHACGHRTGLYTSPHLLHFGERIRIDGVLASEARLVSAFEAVEGVRQDEHLTYFEFTTLAALWLFEQEAVDLRVLEVGLGGRLDAVNVIDANVAVITSIGLDHMAELGDTIDAIAPEKAGVARAGRPAIMAMAEPPRALRATLERIGAQILHANLRVEKDTLQVAGWPQPLARIRGYSDALQRNAVGALLALEALGLRQETLAQNWPTVAENFQLPGRQQRLGDLLLDVAHNQEAAEELARALQTSGLAPCYLVLGMLEGKPVEAVAHSLAPVSQGVISVDLDTPRAIPAHRLAERLRAGGLEVLAEAPTVAEGVARARALNTSGNTIVVSGSFFTVSGALRGA
ncbi:MAG: Mur ligase family protein [Algiphilus sp.]|nr:Mur ligase family protein [Pseudomonadota bacterium]